MSAELVAALEAATGPSRELDARIWLEAVEKPRPGDKLDKDIIGRWPHYTASLDAALTLVPEGYTRSLYFGGNWPAEAKLWRHHDYSGQQDIEAEAKTIALALCIAALRARGAA